jgi:hypothetical protein
MTGTIIYSFTQSFDQISKCQQANWLPKLAMHKHTHFSIAYTNDPISLTDTAEATTQDQRQR